MIFFPKLTGSLLVTFFFFFFVIMVDYEFLRNCPYAVWHYINLLCELALAPLIHKSYFGKSQISFIKVLWALKEL